MLSDFFRINMPYGLAKNDCDEWIAFNREYRIIGCNDSSISEYHHLNAPKPFYTRYKGITETILSEMAWDDKYGIEKDENGVITKVYLYHDGTNPMNLTEHSENLWKQYWDKLEILCKLKIQSIYT